MYRIFLRNILVMSIMLFGFFAFQTVPVFAQTLSQDIKSQVDTAGGKAGLAQENPQIYIASFITIILSITGTLFLMLLLYAGYVRMTSHGEEDRLNKSTKTAVAAILGLTIVLLSYGITRFVLPRVYNAVTPEPVYEENNQTPDEIYKKSIHIEFF